VDPVCHTLVGACLGATGLERKARFGRATLIIAANLPDVDAVLYFWGDARSYAFRRGLTHGIPAILLLPVLLALLMAFLSRISSASRPGQETSLRWLMILALIGVASHPALDWLNNYGMRWLMPVTDRWFYGDALYIVDLAIWLALGAGLFAAYRSRNRRLRWFRHPACLALGFVVLYISMNLSITQIAERIALAQSSDDRPQRLMASPVPFNPFARALVFDYESEYRFARIRFIPLPRFEWEQGSIAKGDPAVLDRARQTREGRWFLRWARFPYSAVEGSGDRILVHIADARYVREIDAPRLRSFGVLSLELSNQ
jgi:inner membrane protein